MENVTPEASSSATLNASSDGYTVVARRYRPKNFEELIGQDHISQALKRAISSGRVGHAYLFTGARGVGKTSTARIFAKALNASNETVDPELAADVARCIDAGDDMDVIEIDGASNRGIEEIRQLRANVNVRPSRSPFKIYIIDEVHMLTTQAFNALLKTLEEPPAHVKFIFCTTDPDKIPITVLSRCQRFDFTPVGFEAIQSRLKEICHCEHFEADDDALALLARRAAGSMRDSQSLLEQVMSFSSDRITVEQVHALLGTADEGRLRALVKAAKSGDALATIQLVDDATRCGAEAGQLAEQLLNYLRDLMAVGLGAGPEVLKLANPVGHDELLELAKAWGTSSILAGIQILDEALVRMRTSVSSVTLLEVALVQICQLESLASIPELLEQVKQAAGGVAGTTPQREKKKTEGLNRPSQTQLSITSGDNKPASLPVPAAASSETESFAANDQPSVAPAQTTDSAAVSAPVKSEVLLPEDKVPQNQSGAEIEPGGSTASDAMSQWKLAVGTIDDMLADFASMACEIVPIETDRWRVVFPPGANRPVEYCQQPERRAALERALNLQLGRTVSLDFSAAPGRAPAMTAAKPRATLRAEKMREMSEHPYVKKLCEVIDGEIIRVDLPSPSAAQPHFAKGKDSAEANTPAKAGSMN